MPKYSIVVPVYNAEAFLHEAVDSVLNQTVPDWELLLIDDGSTDTSREICDYYRKRDSRIKVVSKKNEGVSVARNTALKYAEGEYVIFLDSDDWISKNYLEVSDKVLCETHADLIILNYNDVKYTNIMKGIAISDSLCTGVHNNKKDLIKFTLELASGDSEQWYGMMRPVWAKVFKRCLIQENDIEFDPELKYGEDTAFLCKYLVKTSTIAYRNEYLYYYRYNTASAMNNKQWEGSSHGEHYFSVVEETVKDYSTEDSLAKFWINIAENDWRVLQKEKMSYHAKRSILKELFSTSLYHRFTRTSIAKKLNKKQKTEAFIVRNNIYDAMLLLYYLLGKRKRTKSVYVHFFSEQNYGDDVFVQMLVSRYPNTRFVISGNATDLTAFMGQDNIVIYNENSVAQKINRVIKKLVKIDCLYYVRAFRCDICLTIGGSIFIEPERKHLESYLRDKKCKFYPQKENMILGANFGPYQDKVFVEFFKKEFAKYDLVTFRDLDSYKKFNTISSVKYAPDILFGLEAIYQEKKVLNTESDYIVISVISSANDKAVYVNRIVEIINFYKEKGFQCMLLSLCHKQGDYDLCIDIKNKIADPIKILDYNGDMQNVMQCIKGAKYVIAARFHAIVTSFVFDIPCFPIVYSNKTSNMLEDIGFDGGFCSIDEVANIPLEKIDYNRVNPYTVDFYNIKSKSAEHFCELDKKLC